MAQPNNFNMPEYDLLRKKVSQRVTAQNQEAQDALKRRFAALGSLNSGAHLKNQQVMTENLSRQREDALSNVDMAEAQERARRNEVVENRQFAADEAKKQRVFASEEAGKQRGFQKQLFDIDMAFKGKVFEFEKETKLKELDLAKQQIELDRHVSYFNMDIARQEAKKKGGLFGLGRGIF